MGTHRQDARRPGLCGQVRGALKAVKPGSMAGSGGGEGGGEKAGEGEGDAVPGLAGRMKAGPGERQQETEEKV